MSEGQDGSLGGSEDLPLDLWVDVCIDFAPSPWSLSRNLSTREDSIPFTPAPPLRKYLPGMDNSSTMVISWSILGKCSNNVYLAELDIDSKTILFPNRNECENLYYLTDLKPGSERTFRVRGLNRVGWSNWSNLITYVTRSTEPGKPMR